jgi:hypothetical protein
LAKEEDLGEVGNEDGRLSLKTPKNRIKIHHFPEKFQKNSIVCTNFGIVSARFSTQPDNISVTFLSGLLATAQLNNKAGGLKILSVSG